MKAWWTNLSERDRRVLILGAFVVAVLLFWAFWFEPLQRTRRGLAEAVRQAEADFVAMQAASRRLAVVQSTNSATVFERGGRSLLALADASAREAQLANALTRIEPVSSGRVSVWFESAPFDSIATWLWQLQSRFGIQAEEFSVSRTASPGKVDARIVLVDPAA